MIQEPRTSGPALKVLRLFLEDVRRPLSGADIARTARISAGTLYPLLSRYEKAGVFEASWETIDPREVGRPRRRFYKITDIGIRLAQRVLAEVQVSGGVSLWTP